MDEKRGSGSEWCLRLRWAAHILLWAAAAEHMWANGQGGFAFVELGG